MSGQSTWNANCICSAAAIGLLNYRTLGEAAWYPAGLCEEATLLRLWQMKKAKVRHKMSPSCYGFFTNPFYRLWPMPAAPSIPCPFFYSFIPHFCFSDPLLKPQVKQNSDFVLDFSRARVRLVIESIFRVF
jgi:hypothetical protein